jgi:hypothetical protein
MVAKEYNLIVDKDIDYGQCDILYALLVYHTMRQCIWAMGCGNTRETNPYLETGSGLV